MDDPLPTQIPSVWAFRTGTNEWERLASWPSGCDNGCTVEPSPLYLTAGLGLSFTEPAGSGAEFDAMSPIRRNRYRTGGVRRSPSVMILH